MKYGMNMLIWTDDATGEKYLPMCEKIREIGYDGVELPLFNLDRKALAELGRRLDDMGLERTGVTVRSEVDNPISPDAGIRKAADEKAREILDVCRAAGVKVLCGPLYAALGAFSGKGPTEDEWKRAVESMRRMAEYAGEVGVTLAVEPLNRFEIYMLNSATDAARFVKEVDHRNCGILYDTFHTHIEEKNVADAIRTVSSSLAHVHISENDRSTPGKGQINWEANFSTLAEVCYDGWLMVEAFGLALPALAAATKIWRPMFENEEQLIADALAFMKGNVRKHAERKAEAAVF